MRPWLKKLFELPNQFLRVTCHYPRLFLGISLLTTLFFGVFIKDVEVMDNVDVYSVKNADFDRYQDLKRIFGNDEFFMIAFEDAELFTPQKLALIKKLVVDLKKIDGVRRVRSLTNSEDLFGTEDAFEVRDFVTEIPNSDSELNSLRERAIDNPMYLNNVISPDGRSTGIVVWIHERPGDQHYRKWLLTDVEQLLAPYRPQLPPLHLAGWTVTNVSLSQTLRRDMILLIPLTLILMTVTMYVSFRNVVFALMACLNMILSSVATFGLFGLTGVTFNNITAVTLCLAITLALADSIHVLSHLNRSLLDRFKDKRAAMSSVLTTISGPCFITSVTNAIGFLSLAVSHIPAVREFAWIASAAMLFEFYFSFFFLPQVLLLFPERLVFQDEVTRSTHLVPRFVNWVSQIPFKFQKTVLLICTALTMVGIYYTLQVRIETNVHDYFRESSTLRQDLNFIQTRLGGVATLDITFDTPNRDGLKDPANLKRIEAAQEYVDSIDGVDKTLSLVDLLKDMNQSFHAESKDYYVLPDSQNAIEQFLLLYDGQDLKELVTPAFNKTRISIRLRSFGTLVQARIVRQIEDYLRANFKSPELKFEISGAVRNFLNVALEMVDSQVSSFATATLCIGIVMIVLLRSFSLGLVSLIPNMFPIFINFGIMGIFDVPLDTGTVMIASVALGIAVDDTVHFLYKYKALRETGLSVAQSLKQVSEIKGVAIVTSALTLILGFAVLIIGDFVPVVHFGLLTSLVMVSAIVGDLLLLPALLLLRKS